MLRRNNYKDEVFGLMHTRPREANYECNTLPKRQFPLLPVESHFEKLAICCNKHGSLEQLLLGKTCWPLCSHAMCKQTKGVVNCMYRIAKTPFFCLFAKILFLQFYLLYGVYNIH